MPVTEAQVFAALPPHGFLRQYVHYATQCTDANAVYHVGCGLSILSALAPPDFAFQFGGPLYSNSFVLLVGPSSASRKSSAIGIAQRILRAVNPSLLGEEPGSYEGLIESVRTNPKQVIVYSEFGNFLQKAEDGYLAPIKTAYNIAYDCSDMGRALAKKRSQPVENPRVSLLAGCDPTYLERYTAPVDWTGGFLARFITFDGERERLHYLPPGNAAEHQSIIEGLQKRASLLNTGQCCGMDAGATRLWADWYKEIDGSLSKTANEVSAAVSRAPGMTLKIAMLLCLDFGAAGQGVDWQITSAELIPAIQIARLHVASVSGIGNKLASNKDMRDRRAVLNVLSYTAPKRYGEIVREAKLLSRRAREIIETLREEGTVKESGTGFVAVPPDQIQSGGAALSLPEGPVTEL